MNEPKQLPLMSIPCGITIMPMIDVYSNMYGDVFNAHNALAEARSSKEIRSILQKIYQYRIDVRVSDRIRHMVADIQGSVPAMHTNDFTRSEMCDLLVALLQALDDEIAEEKHQEKIDATRSFFMFLADNAEEFVDWVEQMRRQK